MKSQLQNMQHLPFSSVNHALDVLELFAAARRELGVTEISQHLGFSKSSASRMMALLERRGYLRRNGRSGRFFLGIRPYEIGCVAVTHWGLKDVALPYLERLRDTCDETSHLVVLDGTDVVYIEKLESSHPVRIDSQIGGRAPAFCVAHGRALLAHHPEVLERVLAADLPRFTPRTITDPEALRRELARARRQGYAANNQEWREGVCGVAAPIWNHAGSAAAALSLSMPATRFTRARLDVMIPLLKEVAADLSRALGYAGQEGSRPRPTDGQRTASRPRGGNRHGARPTH